VRKKKLKWRKTASFTWSGRAGHNYDMYLAQKVWFIKATAVNQLVTLLFL
jgi:hypothetical protein